MSVLESLFRVFPGGVEPYDKQGAVSERLGTHRASAAPRNVYETANGHVALSASAQSIFENLADIIGRPELVDDPRFSDNSNRVNHADELDEYIAPWTTERSTDEAIPDRRAGDAVVAPVCDVSDIVADDQNAKHTSEVLADARFRRPPRPTARRTQRCGLPRGAKDSTRRRSTNSERTASSEPRPEPISNRRSPQVPTRWIALPLRPCRSVVSARTGLVAVRLKNTRACQVLTGPATNNVRRWERLPWFSRK